MPRKTESTETSAPDGSDEIDVVPMSGRDACVGVAVSVGDGTREMNTRVVSPPLTKTVVFQGA